MKMAEKVLTGSKRTWSKLPRVMGISRRRSTKADGQPLSHREIGGLRTRIAACVARRGGQTTSSQEAAKLAREYTAWDAAQKRRFLQLLQDEFDIDQARAVEALQAAVKVSDKELSQASVPLRRALVASRTELLRQWTLMPSGVKFLVDLRVDVLAAIKDGLPLKPLDADLMELLESLFNVGMLQLQSIRWDSSASLLEKLIRYEAVHEIQSWNDLKNRLDSDRRCFAFFHPNMPDEPLIFVEVALVKGVADNVQALLDTGATALSTDAADTAVFYSISNTQKGLTGIPFGDFLIKQVVGRLQRDVPKVKRFVTLSPMPRFRAWLEGEEGAALLASLDPKVWQSAGCAGPEVFTEKLKALDTATAGEATEGFQSLLKGLAMHYLAGAKRPGRDTAFDPVAHFHLSNGARIEQINWGGNLSGRGLKESYGLMVNYRYKLERIERHHEDYVHQGTVYVSKAVRALRLKRKPLAASKSTSPKA